MRGLSGTGTQIAASVNDPDRSCKVACQDGYIDHRFYLVNGEQGFFPFGTKCSKKENRYCVSGKCLVSTVIIILTRERTFQYILQHFGDDDIPSNEFYQTLALFRNKREAKIGNDTTKRNKRHFLYYTPVNITERITREFLNDLIANIDFKMTDGKIITVRRF